jgi:hypothetical protein
MKKIVESCNQNNDGTIYKDSVKLRLRGKGSGYKEGPTQKGKELLDKYRIGGTSSFMH